MSLGSAFEIETQLLIAQEVGYFSPEKLEEELKELTILQKQINQLIIKIRHRHNLPPFSCPRPESSTQLPKAISQAPAANSQPPEANS